MSVGLRSIILNRRFIITEAKSKDAGDFIATVDIPADEPEELKNLQLLLLFDNSAKVSEHVAAVVADRKEHYSLAFTGDERDRFSSPAEQNLIGALSTVAPRATFRITHAGAMELGFRVTTHTVKRFVEADPEGMKQCKNMMLDVYTKRSPFGSV